MKTTYLLWASITLCMCSLALLWLPGFLTGFTGLCVGFWILKRQSELTQRGPTAKMLRSGDSLIRS